MSGVLTRKENRDMIVFHVWPALKYPTRLMISFMAIIAGFVIQLFSNSFLLGAPFIACGVILLVTKGYHNRIEFRKYRADASWERVELENVNKVTKILKQSSVWDFSLVDSTHAAGIAMLIVLILFCLVFMVINPIVVFDLLGLTVPFWFTGVKKYMKKPRLSTKINLFKYVLNKNLNIVGKDHETEYMMQIYTKDEKKLPNDVKIKVNIHKQPKGFLGMYSQIVMNSVSGTDYPYFYVVLVTKKGYGLAAKTDSYKPPRGVIKEFKTQKDVEILVIRQKTTKTSGYHTKHATAKLIFNEGIKLAEEVCG